MTAAKQDTAPQLAAISLQSGSNGNCIYVEAESVRLLFDAGLSGRRARDRLARFGRDIRQVEAVLVSHDHSDHVACAGVYSRMFGLPIHITAATHRVAAGRIGRADRLTEFRAGDVLEFGPVRVETLPTPHDGVDGVAFVVKAGGRRLGILTDLGHVFGGLEGVVAGLDAVFIESNYDADMLEAGPYPAFLKVRIRGPGGHVSNLEAARLLARAGGRLRWACLAHLSENNNRPELALETHRRVWAEGFPLHVADRYGPTGVLRL